MSSVGRYEKIYPQKYLIFILQYAVTPLKRPFSRFYSIFRPAHRDLALARLGNKISQSFVKRLGYPPALLTSEFCGVPMAVILARQAGYDRNFSVGRLVKSDFAPSSLSLPTQCLRDF